MGEEDVERILYTFEGDVASLSRATGQAIRLLDDFSSSVQRVTSLSNIAQKAVSAIASTKLAKSLATATNESIRFVENLNLFTVATGAAYDKSMQFVNAMSELYGLDPSNIMRYAGNFYQLADAISMPEEAMASLSLGLTKATTDISSLFNIPVEQVFNDLSAGMQGMSRAVRKYGMDIRTMTLQQTALNLGITENVNSMSEANRQGLRYITMMNQAANASGDFAKTIESPANQLKIFREQMSQLGRAIGSLFINQLAVAIQYINGFIMALRSIFSFIGSLLGVVTQVFGGGTVAKQADDVAKSVGGVGGAASSAAKELKKFLAPFDEINRLEMPDTDSDGSGGGGGGGAASDLLDPAIAETIANMEAKLESIRMKAVQVRDAILEFLGFTVKDGTILDWDASKFEANLIDKFPQWSKTIKATFDNWTDIIEGFKHVFESLGKVAEKVWTKITDFISQYVNDDTVSEFIGSLAGNLEKLSSWIDQHSEGIANFIILLGEFAVAARIAPMITNLVGILQTVYGVIEPIITAVAGLSASTMVILALIGVLIYTLVDLWNTSDEFRQNVTDAFTALVDVLKTLWNAVLKPILDRVGQTIKHLYESFIKPIVEQIANIILTLWSGVIAPLLTWLIESLGPSIVGVANYILGVVDWVVSYIATFIGGLLKVIQGVIDFIAGVFAGDWTRAWQGIVEIFKGVFQVVGSVVVAVMNAVISVINGVISVVYNTVVGFINLLLGVINRIGSWFGQSFELNISGDAPQIGYVNMPALASGGVVSGPTQALIGEGRYDEAVIPLGNSPQMRQFADSVADRVGGEEQLRLLRDQNDLLRQILAKTGTYLDGRELTDVVTRYQRQRARAVGG